MLCTATGCCSLSTLCARFRKAQSLVRCSSSCTRGCRLCCQVRCLFTRMRMTHSCTCTPVAPKWCRSPINSSAVSLTSAIGLKLNVDKTELLFASSGHCLASLKGSYPVAKLGADTAIASSHVCLLGVNISPDLSVDHHTSCLRRRIRQSRDSDSLATLIYAVVNSRMDYCNTVLAGTPRTVTDKLQRVLNTAACVVTGTQEFDHGLGQILHDQLHWLDVRDWVLFELAGTVHQLLNGSAPSYLSEYCIPVSSADTRQRLHSANRHLLAVLCFQLTLTAISRSQLLARWPGTLSQIYPGSNEQHRLFYTSNKKYLFTHPAH